MMKVDAWVDGSSIPNPGKAAWAAYLVTESLINRTVTGTHSHMTNNEAEMNAVLLAVSTITKPVHLTVHTDSQVAWWYVEKGTRKLPHLSKIADEIAEIVKAKGIVLKVIKEFKDHKLIEYAHSEAAKAWRQSFDR